MNSLPKTLIGIAFARSRPKELKLTLRSRSKEINFSFHSTKVVNKLNEFKVNSYSSLNFMVFTMYVRCIRMSPIECRNYLRDD